MAENGDKYTKVEIWHFPHESKNKTLYDIHPSTYCSTVETHAGYMYPNTGESNQLGNIIESHYSSIPITSNPLSTNNSLIQK